jgi:hypothetical protein
MTGRGWSCAALSVALVLGGAAGASALGANPPAGTPDMAGMVVQSADLAAGAVAGQQGYVKPPRQFSAEYVAGFTKASTSDGVSFYSVADLVAIAPSAATVSTFVGLETQLFRSKLGHKLLDTVIIQAAGRHVHLKAKNIAYQTVGSVGVGQSSFLETIGVSARHVSVHEDVILFQQGTVYGFLTLTAEPGETIPQGDATSLAEAMDSHINSVLAAYGSTGATGTS